MYVGVTRAADDLFVTYARRRMLFANPTGIGYSIPSRFLKEINPELMQGYYPSPETPSRYGFEQYGDGDLGSGGRRYEPGGYDSRNRISPSSASNRPAGGASPPAKPRAMRVQPQPSETRSPEPEPVRFEHLVVGDVVQHDKFGIGKVFQVIGEKDKELYNIDFESAGKRLLDPRFAKLVKLN